MGGLAGLVRRAGWTGRVGRAAGRAGLGGRVGPAGWAGGLAGLGYVGSMTRDIRDLVRELNASVGTVVVQAITGVQDRGLPARWARPDGPEPGQASIDRLCLAGRVWRMLEEAEGRGVALAWLMGSNPRLGEATPITAIREMRTAEVVGAAEALIDGSPAA